MPYWTLLGLSAENSSTRVGFGVNTIGEILTREDDMEEDDE